MSGERRDAHRADMARNEEKRNRAGGPEERTARREAASEPEAPPRPHPDPEEAPELLGERSDYPIPRGGE
jgi:hypothetical protein